MTPEDTRQSDAIRLRQQAEDTVRQHAASAGETPVTLPPEETRAALHELHVHQIELEMQNEELRRMQKVLEISRQRYADLYDTTPVGYCTLSEDGVILEANPTAVSLLGTSRSALVGKHLSHFILKEDQDAYYLRHKQLFSGGGTQDFDLRMLNNASATFWAHITAAAARDADGIPVSRVVLSDISLSKQAEAVRRASEERYQLLFERAPEGVFVATAEGKLLSANEAFASMHGYTVPEILQLNLKDLDAPRTSHLIPERMRRLLSGEQMLFEVDHYHKDGHIFQLEVSGSAVTVAGEPCIQCFHRDITERNKIEAFTRDSEERYRALFRDSNSVKLLIDPATSEIKDANDAACGYYGWTHAELCSMNISAINTLSKDGLAAAMEEASEKKRKYFVFKHRLRNGEVRDVEVYSSPVKAGGKTYLYSMVHDITERTLLKQAADKSAFALVERNKELNCLYKVSELLNDDADPVTMRQRIASIVVHSFKFPEIAVCRISCGGGEYISDNFKPGAWSLRSAIMVNDEPRGSIEVGYTEERPPEHTGPFLPEEQEMLDAVADMMGKTLQRKQAQDSADKFQSDIALLLDSTAEAIYGIDKNGDCTFCNRAFLSMFGYTKPGELIGKNMHDQIHFKLADGSPFPIEDCDIWRAFKNGENMHSNYEVFWRSDGTCLSVECWSHIQQKGDEIVGAVVTLLDITERKQAEEKLREANNLFATVANSSTALVWMSGTDKLCNWFNEPWLAFTGRTMEQEMGNGWAEGVFPDDFDACLKTYVEAFDKRQPFVMEYRLRHHSGEYRWIIDPGVPRYDAEGNFAGYIGSCLDITDHKQVEQKLKESETRYRSLFDLAIDGVTILSKEGKLLSVNEAYANAHGYSIQEMLGMDLKELDSPESARLAPERMLRLLAGEKLTFELEHHHKNGNTFSLEVSASMVSIGGEGYILSFHRDITARKQAESALLESNSSMRAITDSAQDAIIMMDEKHHVSFWNPAAETILGYTSAEAMGKDLHALFEPAEYHQAFRAGFAGFNRTGEGGAVGKTLDLKAIRKDGRVIQVQLALSAVKISADWHAVGIIHDITERKAADDKIKASLAEKEVILKEIHHRVKNNMQVISSLLNLQSKYVKDKDDAELFRESRERIQSMSLVYNKLYESENLANISFSDYLNDLVSGLIRSYNCNTGKITTRIEAVGVELGLDLAIPCGLIINEVISNSLKYAFPGGRSGEIKVIMSVHEGRIEMLLGDNGVGLAQEIDIKASKTLGMSLLQTLAVHQLGGKLEMNRENGTEYRISFPLVNED